jgi:hypothetical protein
MSQIVLDEHLGRTEVLTPLRRWITTVKIEDLAPDETLKDDRILQILCRQRQPTFVTLDADFFHKRLCDRRYCLIYFVVPRQQQRRIPLLLRQLLRLREFSTKAARMGKVVRIQERTIEFWQVGIRTQQLVRFG